MRSFVRSLEKEKVGRIVNFGTAAMLKSTWKKVKAEADKIGARYSVGNLLSSDIFYNANPDASKKWERLGILGVEMEAAALYMNAAYAGKRALAICTVSDHLLTGESLDSAARQNSFTEMMEIALNTAIRL